MVRTGRAAAVALLALLAIGSATTVAVGGLTDGGVARDVATAGSGGTAGTSAHAVPNDTTDATTVTVAASGQASAQPDVAVLHLESSATAEDPGTAADRLARNVSRLRAALRAADVPADRITTSSYDLSRERPGPGPTPGATDGDYVARQRLAVRVANTSRVGELIDVAVANGATAVEGVEFTLSDEQRSRLHRRALEGVMATARERAETVATAEGLTLTGVRRVTTGDDGPGPVATEAALASGDAGTRVESGPVTVGASVRVTYVARVPGYQSRNGTRNSRTNSTPRTSR